MPGVSAWRFAPKIIAVGGHRVLQGDGLEFVAVALIQNAEIRFTQPRRIREYCPEYRIHLWRVSWK